MQPLNRMFACLILLMGIATMAVAETHRIEDAQTGWYWYTNQTAAQITDIINNTGSRIIDIEITSSSPLRFTAAFVKNSGVYASGWWWYYGISFADIGTFLAQNTGRLIDIERYVDGSGVEKFAVVMVPNTGSQQKTWWYYAGVTTAAIDAELVANEARLVDIEAYSTAAGTRYACVMIKNAGADAAGWGWFYNTPVANVIAWMNANNMRILEFEVRNPTAQTVDAVLISNTFHTPKTWWWYYNVRYADIEGLWQQAGSRIVDIDTYEISPGDRRYNLVMLNNSNSLTVEIADILDWGNDGDTGLYLKEVGGNTLASLMPDYQFEPASTIKAIHNFHSVRRIQAGTSDLLDLLPFTATYNGSCPLLPNAGFDQLGDLMRDMMVNSDNAATFAIANEFGAANIEDSARNIAGMTSTELNHTLGCGSQAIANPNRLTLRDAGTLYEGVEDMSLLNMTHRDLFYSVMQNQDTPNPWWHTDNLFQLVDEEGAILGAQNLTSFKAAMRFAWKPGGYTLIFGGSTHEYVSVAGVVTIPTCGRGGFGEKSYVFGVFVDDAAVNPFNRVDDAAKELFRDLIRNAIRLCPSDVDDQVPATMVTLEPNVPNPFNPRTDVIFSLGSERPVTLTIHDISGREIAVLASEIFPAGRHSIPWNGLDHAGLPVSSGTYFARIVSGIDVQSRKLLLLR